MKPVNLDKTIPLTIKVDSLFLDQVNLFCTNHKINRSEMIRRAVEEYIANHKSDTKMT